MVLDKCMAQTAELVGVVGEISQQLDICLAEFQILVVAVVVRLGQVLQDLAVQE
jgi:hypothetical protein